MKLTQGYLIVQTHKKFRESYINRFGFCDKAIYGIPCQDEKSKRKQINYRGVDRNALTDYEKSDNLAEIFMVDLTRNDRCWDGIIFAQNDALEAFSLLAETDDYELIWISIANADVLPPNDYYSLGFEASYFDGDHFSASNDCLFFPRWHGTDAEGILFCEHFDKLNENGLFKSAEDAAIFLKYYLSFDWTERGEFKIIEVFAQNN